MNMPPEFDPTTRNELRFREALGAFATGVTVVTAPTGTGPIGMTANSFTSISLDPPLVLWCPAKHSLRYPHFVAAAHFAIHVMRDDQQALVKEFARRGDAFDRVDWHAGENAVPLIDDCLARFECATRDIHDGGDHAIVVAEVAHVVLNQGSPLVFALRGFGGFRPQN